MFRDVPECSGMFRNVPGCSRMFHVPGFVNAPCLACTTLLKKQHKEKINKANKRESRRRIYTVTPLSSIGDKHLISPYIITTSSNIQVTRITEMITGDKMSRCVSKLSKVVPQEMYREL